MWTNRREREKRTPSHRLWEGEYGPGSTELKRRASRNDLAFAWQQARERRHTMATERATPSFNVQTIAARRTETRKDRVTIRADQYGGQDKRNRATQDREWHLHKV